MNLRQVDVFRIAMRGPGDVGGLEALLRSDALRVQDIVAILGKTEGNGGVNDFTREYASRSFTALLAAELGCSSAEVEQRVALVMSGGTEGVLSPHATVFARRDVIADLGGGKRLAVGMAHTRDFLPEELGGAAQILETAAAVRAAMEDAGVTDPADVHFVQIKCPLLTAERVESARRRGQSTVTEDSYGSMAYSRGASAIGVALALGEVSPAAAVPGAVLNDETLYSSVASTSAGVELLCNAVVVLGNAEAASGDLVVGHAVMRDALDLRGVLEAFASAGLDAFGLPAEELGRRVVNVFAKAEPSPNGLIRGLRHTMLDDTDLSPTRHARAAVGGLIASVAGTGAVYISGGAEHQGPPGGGPVAVIARAATMA